MYPRLQIKGPTLPSSPARPPAVSRRVARPPALPRTTGSRRGAGRPQPWQGPEAGLQGPDAGCWSWGPGPSPSLRPAGAQLCPGSAALTAAAYRSLPGAEAGATLPLQPPWGLLGAALASAEAGGRTPGPAHTPSPAVSDTAAKPGGLMLHDPGLTSLPRPAPTGVPMAPRRRDTSAGDTDGGFRGPGGGPAPQPGGADAPLSLQVRTADMGGYATSLDFTQAVIAALDV